MAVYSMTGYANAVADASATSVTQTAAPIPSVTSSPERTSTAAGSVSVELRSVNGRFLDLAMRLPDDLRGLEPTLREWLTARFKRGKVELRMTSRGEAECGWPEPQAEQLDRLARLEAVVRAALPEARRLSVHEALQWCKGGARADRLDDAALDAARRAIDGLAAARAREGDRLVAVLRERVQTLRSLADQAEPLVPQTVKRQQQRFLERWHEALEATGAQSSVSGEALEERALNEAAAYAIRIDVAEELARLRAHLDEIDRLLAKGGEVGKRLDFLIQELLREANTLASKASALELTNISVEMKVAIEQLREQVQNIE